MAESHAVVFVMGMKHLPSAVNVLLQCNQPGGLCLVFIKINVATGGWDRHQAEPGPTVPEF